MYLKSPKGARASWMGRMLGLALFAGIVILAVFVLIVDRLLDLLESSVITWRPSSASRTISS